MIEARVVVVLTSVLSLFCGAAEPSVGKRLASLAQPHRGKVAIALKHLDTGEEYYLNADESMPTGSLIKLAIMAETFQQVAEGRVKFTDLVTLRDADREPGSGVLTDNFNAGLRFPLRDATRLMISVSDNTATNLVLDKIGVTATSRRMAAWGYPCTKLYGKVNRPARDADPEAVKRFGLGSTTARETLHLLERLHRGTLVSASASREMLAILKLCRDSAKLRRFLPDDVVLAQKTGADLTSRTAAGIVYSKAGPIALCVLTAENKDTSWSDDNAAELLCARVAKEVYDHFHSPGPKHKRAGLKPSGAPADQSK